MVPSSGSQGSGGGSGQATRQRRWRPADHRRAHKAHSFMRKKSLKETPEERRAREERNRQVTLFFNKLPHLHHLLDWRGGLFGITMPDEKKLAVWKAQLEIETGKKARGRLTSAERELEKDCDD